MRRRKKCRYCREWYRPHPQTYRVQTACSNARCRRLRRRAAWKRWSERNPIYAESRRDKQRAWRKSHPSKDREFRAKNPAYVERNRRLQRMRNARHRGVIAKPNTWTLLRREKLMRIRYLGLIAKPNAWDSCAEVFRRQIEAICVLLQSSG